MKPKKLGAITLAISLIGLGILVLVSNLSPSFHFTEALKYFIPIVLIALGSEFFVVSAINRRRARAEGLEEPNLQFDGKSIVLIFVIVVCLVVYSIVMGFAGNVNRYFHVGTRGWESRYAREDLETLYSGAYETSALDVTALKGANACGDIQVAGSDTRDITIEYSFQAIPSFQEHAGTIDESSFRFQKEGGTVTFGLSTAMSQAISDFSYGGSWGNQNSGSNGVFISYVITVPSNLALDLAQSFGTIKITGCGSVTAETSYSDVYLTDIGGELNLDAAFADVTLDNIHAPSRLALKYGSMEGSVSAPFALTSGFSDAELTVPDVLEGNVSVDSEYGDVVLNLASEQGGQFTVNSSFGSVFCPAWELESDSPDSEIRRSVGEGGPAFTFVHSFGDLTINFD